MARKVEERIIPTNIHAETVILGAILLDNNYMVGASSLEPEDFSLDSHKRIFMRMRQMLDKGTAVDLVTLVDYMGREVSDTGGVAYLASLTEGLPIRPAIREYVRIVKEKSALRKIISVCELGIEKAFEQESSVEICKQVTGELPWK
jgi:replicative DNA helicase